MKKFILALTVLFLLGLFLFETCPSLYFRDSGELITASRMNGIAHPTGFPLYLILASLSTYFPFGSIPFRINLLSSLLGALTLIILLGHLQRKTLPAVGPVATSLLVLPLLLLLFASPIFYLHTTTCEVYPLVAFGILLLITIYRHPLLACQSKYYLLSFLLGVFLGSHVTFWPAAFLWLAYWLENRSRLAPRTFILSLAFIILGSSVYLYLPAMAHHSPYINWGTPDNLENFLRHISGFRIRRAFAQEIAAVKFSDGSQFIKQVLQPLSFGILLIVAGVYYFFRKGRLLGIALLVMLCLDGIYAVTINPMGLIDLQNGLVSVMILFYLMTFGLITIQRRILHSDLKKLLRLALVLAVTIGLGYMVLITFPGANQRLNAYHDAHEYSRRVLKKLAPKSSILAVSDDLNAGLLYFQMIEQYRPDVIAIVDQHVWDIHYLKRLQKWYQRKILPNQALAQYAKLPETDRIKRQQQIRETIVQFQLAQAAVYFEYQGAGGNRATPLEKQAVPLIPIFQYRPGPAQPIEPKALQEEFQLFFEGFGSQLQTQKVISSCANSIGSYFLSRGQQNIARSLLLTAIQFYPQNTSALNNMGVFYSERLQFKEAIAFTKKAHELNPNSQTVLGNLARYYLRVDPDKALHYYRRLKRVAPYRGDIYLGFGIIAANKKNYAKARKYFIKGLELEPGQLEIQSNLAKLDRLLKEQKGNARNNRQ